MSRMLLRAAVYAGALAGGVYPALFAARIACRIHEGALLRFPLAELRYAHRGGEGAHRDGAHGFTVRAAPVAREGSGAKPRGMGCPHCGGKLRWCSAVLPRPLGSRGLMRMQGASNAPPGVGEVCLTG